ncbi:MAG TPA: cyclic pyranopterin monophosphate synthase MoaC [Bacteroidales bacterium]|jgi:cyclic pyranopterin phosphate synthase|nr:cyclic pyranopterin monophosphate synthase MoaC [Bacteroidales bacterium]HPT09987.1 cyclic pyranopterin monophosphate synthase MoaC [Bacteroidales bacterium]
MNKLSHVSEEGKAKMVDVTAKPDLLRRAVARGKIVLEPGTVALIRENKIKKGAALTVAEIAGIQGGKQTSNLIPLCHPLLITHIEVTATLEETGVTVVATTRCKGATGIEMEALTAVSTALLTVYDMCKAVDKKMVIGEIQLVEKTKEEV